MRGAGNSPAAKVGDAVKRGGARRARNCAKQTNAAGRGIGERFREHMPRNGECEVERRGDSAMRALTEKREQSREGEMSRIIRSSMRKSGGIEGGFVKMQSDPDGERLLEKPVPNPKETRKQVGNAPAPRSDRRGRAVSCALHPKTRDIRGRQNGREASLPDPFRKRFPGFMRHQDSRIRRTEFLPVS